MPNEAKILPSEDGVHTSDQRPSLAVCELPRYFPASLNPPPLAGLVDVTRRSPRGAQVGFRAASRCFSSRRMALTEISVHGCTDRECRISLQTSLFCSMACPYLGSRWISLGSSLAWTSKRLGPARYHGNKPRKETFMECIGPCIMVRSSEHRYGPAAVDTRSRPLREAIPALQRSSIPLRPQTGQPSPS